MVRRLGLGKNNHLTYASLALNPRNSAILYKGDKFVTFDLGSCRLQASSRHGSALKGKNLQSCTIAYTGDGSST